MSNLNFSDELNLLVGKQCCRTYVNEEFGRRRFCLGFGKKVEHGKKNLPFSFYGEWEIGAYQSSWRVIVDGKKIVAGSNDVVESTIEISEKVKFLLGKAILNITQLSNFDIRIILEDNVYVDFLSTFDEDDHVVHLFAPENRYHEFVSNIGWRSEIDNNTSKM